MQRPFAIFITAAAALATLLSWPLLGPPDTAWHRDWPYFHHLAAVAEQSWRAGAWPDYNPWHCAGFDMATNPQGPEWSPAFLLVLLAGPGLGLRLLVWLHLAAGAGAAAACLRRIGLRPAAAIWGGLSWGLMPPLAAHISEGHLPFVAFALLPALLYLLGQAARSPRWTSALVPAALAGWMLLLGGFYAVAFAGLFAAIDATALLVRRRETLPRVSGHLALAGTLAFALSAVRLLPALQWLSQHPRTPIWRDGLHGDLAVRAFTSHETGPLKVIGEPFDWPEYALNPGWGLLALAATGLLVRHRLRPAAALWAFGGLLLAFGAAITWLDALRQAIPLIGNLQVAARYGLVAGAGLASLAALAVHAASSNANSPAQMPRWGAWVIAALALTSLAEQTRQNFAWYAHAPTDRPIVRGPFAAPDGAGHMEGWDRRLDEAPSLGLALFPCYEPLPHRAAPAILRARHLPALRTVPPANASVHLTSPSEWHFDFGPGVDRALWSQTCQAHWQAEGGQVRCGEGGVVELLPSGPQMTLRYANPWRQIGLWVSAIAWLGLLAAAGWILAHKRTRPEPPK